MLGWWILIIVLLIIALGGFGHSGYRRGWYGRGYEPGAPVTGGWSGSFLGLGLLLLTG